MSIRVTARDMGAIAGLDRILQGLATGIRSALQTGGNEGMQKAKSVCPVKTGRLRDSITFAMSGDTSGTLSNNTDYGLFVEMGTASRPARPHIRPGAEIMFKRVQEELKKNLRV